MEDSTSAGIEGSICEEGILSVTVSVAKEAVQRLFNGYQGYYGPAKTNTTNCWLAQKATNKGAGKGWVKLNLTGDAGAMAKYYSHHLVLIAAGKDDLLRIAQRNGLQLSHLCHHPNCFNWEHITLETGEANIQRTMCKGWKWAVCPCGCNHTFNPCQHQPPCILPPASCSDPKEQIPMLRKPILPGF